MSNMKANVEYFTSMAEWYKPRRRVWAKIISILVSVTFVFPYLTWAFEAASFPGPTNLVMFNQQPVKIAHKLGTITQSFQGSDRLVVHVQDLHCNYEVQNNIAKMIDVLAGEHGLELVGIEGASLPVNATAISSFPVTEVKKETAHYLVKQGKLTGAEMYAATGQHRIRLEGIENAGLYAHNRTTVMKFLNNESQGYIFDLRETLDELKREIYNPALTALDKKKQDFREGDLSLLKYSVYLYGFARRGGREELSLYPNLRAYVSKRKAIFSDLVDSDGLFHELDLLDRRLRAGMYTSTEQEKLDLLEHRLDIMEKLVNISASPQDLAEYRVAPEGFRVQKFLDFIARHDDLEEFILDAEVYKLDEYLGEVRSFYQVADDRSRAFVENIMTRMQKHQAKVSMLVTGGYHTDMVLDELKQKGVSYLCIKPRLSRQDIVNPYFALLREQRTPLEKLLAQNQNILGIPIMSRQTNGNSYEVMTLAEFLALSPKERLNVTTIITLLKAGLLASLSSKQTSAAEVLAEYKLMAEEYTLSKFGVVLQSVERVKQVLVAHFPNLTMLTHNTRFNADNVNVAGELGVNGVMTLIVDPNHKEAVLAELSTLSTRPVSLAQRIRAWMNNTIAGDGLDMARVASYAAGGLAVSVGLGLLAFGSITLPVFGAFLAVGAIMVIIPHISQIGNLVQVNLAGRLANAKLLVALVTMVLVANAPIKDVVEEEREANEGLISDNLTRLGYFYSIIGVLSMAAYWSINIFGSPIGMPAGLFVAPLIIFGAMGLILIYKVDSIEEWKKYSLRLLMGMGAIYILISAWLTLSGYFILSNAPVGILLFGVLSAGINALVSLGTNSILTPKLKAELRDILKNQNDQENIDRFAENLKDTYELELAILLFQKLEAGSKREFQTISELAEHLGLEDTDKVNRILMKIISEAKWAKIRLAEAVEQISEEGWEHAVSGIGSETRAESITPLMFILGMLMVLKGAITPTRQPGLSSPASYQTVAILGGTGDMAKDIYAMGNRMEVDKLIVGSSVREATTSAEHAAREKAGNTAKKFERQWEEQGNKKSKIVGMTNLEAAKAAAKAGGIVMLAVDAEYVEGEVEKLKDVLNQEGLVIISMANRLGKVETRKMRRGVKEPLTHTIYTDEKSTAQRIQELCPKATVVAAFLNLRADQIKGDAGQEISAQIGIHSNLSPYSEVIQRVFNFINAMGPSIKAFPAGNLEQSRNTEIATRLAIQSKHTLFKKNPVSLVLRALAALQAEQKPVNLKTVSLRAESMKKQELEKIFWEKISDETNRSEEVFSQDWNLLVEKMEILTKKEIPLNTFLLHHTLEEIKLAAPRIKAKLDDGGPEKNGTYGEAVSEVRAMLSRVNLAYRILKQGQVLTPAELAKKMKWSGGRKFTPAAFEQSQKEKLAAAQAALEYLTTEAAEQAGRRGVRKKTEAGKTVYYLELEPVKSLEISTEIGAKFSSKASGKLVISSEVSQKEKLVKWIKDYFQLKTAGYRGVTDPEDINNPAVLMNINKVALYTYARALIYKEKYGDKGDIHVSVGGDVRYHTKEFIDLIARIYAAQGITVHVKKGYEPSTIWEMCFGAFYDEHK
ncbi:hypothetical protein KAR10_06130, partial [bacterium]|nr:hypothetical protein [bacterium]